MHSRLIAPSRTKMPSGGAASPKAWNRRRSGRQPGVDDRQHDDRRATAGGQERRRERGVAGQQAGRPAGSGEHQREEAHAARGEEQRRVPLRGDARTGPR
jgi:hypothetical protein